MNDSARTSLREKLIYGAAYTAFFFVAFVIAAYETFPYDRLRDLIVDKLSQTDTDSGDAMTVKIGALKPSWITGVRIDDIEIVRSTKEDPEPAKLHIDSVTLRVSPFALMMGTKKASASATVGDGKVDVSYAEAETSQQIDAELDSVDVHALGLGGWIGVPLKGMANGTVNVTLDQDPTKSAGDIALKIEGLHVGDGKAKIKVPGMAAGMTLDEIDAGALDMGLNLHEGVADVERFTSNGRDLKVDGSGAVRLAVPMRHARLDLLLELKFSDAFKNKSDRTKSLFELMNMQPEWHRAIGTDGTIRMHLGGSIQALRATPSNASGRIMRAPPRKHPDKP